MSAERIVELLLAATPEERGRVWGMLDRAGVTVYEVEGKLSSLTAYGIACSAGGTDRLREAASRDPEYAFLYARDVDKGASEVTRRGACGSASFAREYALGVDEGPHDETRIGASRSPKTAVLYAMDVDRCPHDVTREGACGSPRAAGNYAHYVDKGYHPDTWRAVRGTQYAPRYRREAPVPEGLDDVD